MRWLVPLFVLCAGPAWGQQVVDVGSMPSCTRCGIFLTGAVTLSDTAGAASLTLPDEVARVGGRYLVASTAAPGEIAVFGGDGELLGFAGGFGDAPGQFRRIGRILVHRDTVHVFDLELSRWTRLNRDLELIDAVPLPLLPLRAVFWGDDLVINAPAPAAVPELAGQPLHVVSRDGAITRSFGRDTVPGRANIPYAEHRIIATCPDGTLWWSRIQEYQLHGVSREGTERVLNRTASWFQPHTLEPQYTETGGRPPPMLAAMRCDEQNRIWTLTNVGDPQWRRAGLRPEVEPEDPQADWQLSFDPERYFDTVIEIIDTSTGQLLTALRAGQYFDFFLAPGWMAVYTEAAGLPQVEVWRADLLQVGEGNG